MITQLHLFGHVPPHQRGSASSRRGAVKAAKKHESRKNKICKIAMDAGSTGITRDEVATMLRVRPSDVSGPVWSLVRAGVLVRTGRTRPSSSGVAVEVLIHRDFGGCDLSKQQNLPIGKREYRRRLTALESLSPDACGLPHRRMRLVQDFVKRIFKHQQSSCEGDLTFVQVANADRHFSLADEFFMSRSSVQRRIRWAQESGLLEVSIDCDDYGMRRTTVSICWGRILKLFEKQSVTTDDQSVTVTPDQSANYADQSVTTDEQSVTTDEQSVTVTLSTIPNTNSQSPKVCDFEHMYEAKLDAMSDSDVATLVQKHLGDYQARLWRRNPLVVRPLILDLLADQEGVSGVHEAMEAG